ncbi:MULTISPECIES: hypothetical protein [unclassified Bradyrhizobium]|uniref:hypothetical protein n=1 Tax=unclassified Bradyrhizobium TaxID=2631580 RepID=UPI0028E234A6|nr:MULTISPECIES: hypothetical protein [unclassified Bradyrhizobium]
MSSSVSPISQASIEQAPFIYFDGATCFGQNGGAIQIELAANVLMPDDEGVKILITQTAHLRCSPGAAANLRDALDKAIAMVQQGQDQPISVPLVKN